MSVKEQSSKDSSKIDWADYSPEPVESPSAIADRALSIDRNKTPVPDPTIVGNETTPEKPLANPIGLPEGKNLPPPPKGEEEKLEGLVELEKVETKPTGPPSTIVEVLKAKKAKTKPEKRNIFLLTEKVRAVLDGCSQKEYQEVLGMVASLKNLRVISSDRNIGQNKAVTVRTVPEKSPAKKEKGRSTQSPSWKLSEPVRALNSKRDIIVKQMRSLSKDSAEFPPLLENLRDLEKEIKALNPLKPGDP